MALDLFGCYVLIKNHDIYLHFQFIVSSLKWTLVIVWVGFLSQFSCGIKTSFSLSTNKNVFLS